MFLQQNIRNYKWYIIRIVFIQFFLWHIISHAFSLLHICIKFYKLSITKCPWNKLHINSIIVIIMNHIWYIYYIINNLLTYNFTKISIVYNFSRIELSTNINNINEKLLMKCLTFAWVTLTREKHNQLAIIMKNI